MGEVSSHAGAGAEQERKSNAGARPYDVIVMFKLLVLQSLYNLSDEALEARKHEYSKFPPGCAGYRE